MTNKELKAIMKLFESSSLSRIKLEREGVTIELEKEQPKQVVKELVHSAPEPTNKPEQTKTSETNDSPQYTPVKAPLVGTYYEAPAPDQPPFVRVGQTVNKGDTLFIIEAMKVMNEIPSPQDGVIKAIHIKNGDMVMFDQLLVEIA